MCSQSTGNHRNVVPIPHLSKFRRLVWPKFVFTVRFCLTDKVFWQFVCLKNRLLLKCDNRSRIKPSVNENVSRSKIDLRVFPLVNFVNQKRTVFVEAMDNRAVNIIIFIRLSAFQWGNSSFKLKHSTAG